MGIKRIEAGDDKAGKMVLLDIALLDANPFRDLKTFPVDEDRVAAMATKIKRNGIWPRLQARPHGERFQIPYGHTELAALRALYKEHKEIPVKVIDITDAEMIRWMTDENDPEDHNWALDDLVAVSAVVTAFGVGTIKLAAPFEKTNKAALRYAPSFIRLRADDRRASDDHPKGKQPDPAKAYNAGTVARFLKAVRDDGTTAQQWVKDALRYMELVEREAMTPDELRGLTREEAGHHAEAAAYTMKVREEKEREALKAKEAEEAKKAKEADPKWQARAAERERRQKADAAEMKRRQEENDREVERRHKERLAKQERESSELRKLVKMLALLGSNHDGEVLAAARAAETQRKKMGKSWGELIGYIDE